MKQDILYTVEIPEGVNVSLDGTVIKVSGEKGVVEKSLPSLKVKVAVSDKEVTVSSPGATKREKKLANTFRAHIRHMIVGVIEGHTYKLKVCSGHFPMTVTVKNNVVEVKNFLGETKPRRITLLEGADVNVSGDEITVVSPSKEIAGQVAGSIEQITRITNRDRRIFQDGIYITEKSKVRLLAESEE